MAPVEKVKIFLANSVNDGIVLSKEFSNAIEVEFGEGEDSDIQVVDWDGKTRNVSMVTWLETTF